MALKRTLNKSSLLSLRTAVRILFEAGQLQMFDDTVGSLAHTLDFI